MFAGFSVLRTGLCNDCCKQSSELSGATENRKFHVQCLMTGFGVNDLKPWDSAVR
jgi:hypothetical protein